MLEVSRKSARFGVFVRRRDLVAAAASPARRLWLLAALLMVVFFVVGPANAAAEPLCTDMWTGSSEGSWQTASNWSTSAVPTSSDVVCIGAGHTVEVSGGTNYASSIQGEGGLALSGGSLEAASALETSSIAHLSLDDGSLDVAGELDVTSSFATSGNSTVGGSGSLVLESGATGAIDEASCSLLTLNGATFVNHGTASMGASGGLSGQVDMEDGAKLENAGTFNADSYEATCVPGSNKAAIQTNGGSAPSVTNSGTFNVDVGSSNSVTIDMPFNNDGTVDVQTGVLSPTGGDSSSAGGTWVTSSGATVDLTSSFSFADADASEAKVQVAGGTIEIASGTSTIGTLDLSSGTLAVAGDLDVSSSLSSGSDPTVSGSGQLTVESDASGTIDGSSCSLLTLNTVKLVNDGTLTMGSSGGSSGQMDMEDGAELENAGTFNADAYKAGCVPGSNEASLQANGGSTPSVTNAGAWNVNVGGANAVTVNLPFNNEGTVDVQSGVFSPTGGDSASMGGTWVTSSEAVVDFTGGFSLMDADASYAKIEVGGGTLEIASGTSTIGTLELSTGILDVAGDLDVSSSLSSGSDATVSGSGQLTVESDASGTIDGSSCSLLTLNTVKLVNDGTLTMGSSGGSSGQIDMENGAKLENTGTFNADAYKSGCVPGSNEASLQDNGGSTPTVTNTGTWNVNVGSANAVTVNVPFNNMGTLEVQDGTIQFEGGGVPEHVATGYWQVASGGEIVFSSGTFLIGEEVDLSVVHVTGGTVERVPVSTLPRGSLNALPYASHTVTVSGSGTGVGGSGFGAASIEVTSAGHSEWKALCGPLTPNMLGEFDCSWNTASGSPDGDYQVRAQLSNSETPPQTGPTTAITVLVDNTPPSGSVTPPSYIGAASTITGGASDSGSGVASWQLEIAPEGSSEWTDGCVAQTTSISGSTYGCTVSTTSLSEGVYGARALITDKAGNAYTTSTASTRVDKTPPTGSLDTASETGYLKGDVSLKGSGEDSISGVESWVTQITPAGAGSWSDACTPQTMPVSGSSYACTVITSDYSDGAYELRVRVLNNATDTYTTATQSVTLDNTPPSGSLDPLERHSKGTVEVKGPATDAISGVESWQLQITPTGEHSWTDACAAQTSPSEGLYEYGCSLNTTELTDGSYQLHAVITDKAGNTYTTSPIATWIENSEGEAGTEAGCTDTWTGDAGGKSWTTAGDWSSASVPSSTDRACIPTGASVQVTSTGHDVGSLAGEGSLTVDGGSLELSDGSTVSEINSLALESGVLTDPGALDIYGSLQTSGNSALDGTGDVYVESGATGAVDNSACSLLLLSGVTFVNDGTIITGSSGGSSGQVDLENGALLRNAGTFNADAYEAGCVPGTNNAAIQTNGGGTPSVTNTGTFNVNVGSANAVTVNVLFNNQGTVDVQSGTLTPAGGDSSSAGGTWTSSSGAGVAITSNSFSLKEADASGAKFSVSGGTLEVPSGASTVGSLSLTGGTLAISGDLDVSTSLSSSSDATVSGTGQLSVQSGASGTVDGSSCSLLTLNAVKFVNDGTVTVGSSGGSSGQIDLEDGAQLENEGTLNADTYKATCVPGSNEASIQTNGGGTPTVTNTGTFNANAGSSNTVTVDLPFDNQGAVTVQSGTMQLSDGGAGSGGSWSAESSTTLDFAGGTFSSSSENWSGTGTISVAGATVTAKSLDGSEAKLAVSSGSFDASSGTSTVGNLNLTGGIVSVAATLDVTSVFDTSGSPTVSGTGDLVVESGASGTIDDPGCSRLLLSEAKLVNDGTLTVGASGGSLDGSITMQDGANLENIGTFNTDAYESGCGPESNGYSFRNNGGSSPSITNTGTFNIDIGSGNTAQIAVPLNNQGTVKISSGTIQLTDGGSGTEGMWSPTSGTTLLFTGGSFALSGDTLSGEGSIGIAGASVTGKHLNASAATIDLSGGMLAITEGTTDVAHLSVTGGTVSISSTLEVTSSLGMSGTSTVTGGSLIVGPGANGKIDDAACSLLTVSATDVVNDGTLTVGGSGGLSGQIAMQNGAQLNNTGTFNADAYPASCVSGPNYDSIYTTEGSAPAVINTGTFNVNVGSANTFDIAVPFDNQDTVNGQSGTLQLSDGGIAEEAAGGSWHTTGSAQIVFSAGTFIIVTGTDLSAVLIEGAHLTWVARGLTGSLGTLSPYIAGTAIVTGSGEGGVEGSLESVIVEVASAGSGTWHTLCGSLTPSLVGGFECSWATASGSYPDGDYELRAKLSGGASETVTTSTLSAMVDNTPPTGSVTAPPSHGVAGVLAIAGTAGDSGSGVQSWQPEIAAEGSSTWSEVCPAQTIAVSGDEYACPIETSKYTNGTYELRAKVTDNAGNTYTASTVDLHIANETVSGTLEAPSILARTVAIEGKGEAKTGSVESWEVQVALSGTSSWSAACPAQTTPVSGSTYRCSIATEGLTDGAYELRVLVTGDSGDTYTTVPVPVTVDSTPPTGFLYPVFSPVSGAFEPQGYAEDTGSGVAEWILEVTPSGSDTWKEACLAQTMPLFGAVYGCDMETGTLTEGEYELRATIKDRAANTYTTPVISFTVENTAPSSTASPTISGRTIAGHTLSATKGIWAGASPITYAYQWQRCNSTGEDCESISSASESTYVLASEDVGKTIRVEVTASNGAGETSASSAASGVVLANTLGNIAEPGIAGSPQSGSTLSADPGEWSGALPFSYAYQWQLCNSKGEACSNIAGATAQRYTLVEADLSGTLRVIVTATDSEGSANETSPASPVIVAGSGPGIRYLYDEVGRLHIVDDPSHGAAVYEWDADGNLLSIKRDSQSTVSVLAVTPSHAPTGAHVDITGTGYSPEPSYDTVKFDGVTATVDEASATDLIVTVPEGAGEGEITVTVGEESAKSSGDFAPHVARLHEGGVTPPVVSLAAITPPPLATTNPTATGHDTTQHSTSAAKTIVEHCVKKKARAKKCELATRKTPAKRIRVGEHARSGRGCSHAASRPHRGHDAHCATNSHRSRRLTRARRATRPRAPKKGAQEPPRSSSYTTPNAASESFQSALSAQELDAYKTPYPATWTPGANNRKDENWMTGRAPSPWERLPALAATHGTTGLSGQALAIDGMPLANLTLSIQGTNKQTKTDRTGRFLLAGLPAGHHVLIIDGETAEGHNIRYGQFTVAVEVASRKITPLGYTIWMTPLEAAGEKTIPADSKHETVLTNPHIPGLEVRLPAGTTVRTATGSLVRKVNLTAIPVDRPPFPLPLFATGVPTYFTVQPGGAYLSKGAQIVYPNWGHLPPGQRVEFWNYDPTGRGWYVYGKGTVSTNGQQVVPDPNVRIWEFTGAMITTELEAPETGPKEGASINAGDPVDLATGLFVYQHTDLQVPDSLMPLALTRTYRQKDNNSYSFGVGTQSPFEIHLWSDENYKTAYLVLAAGSKIKYVRTSSGTGYENAEYEAVETPGQWQGSILRWTIPTKDWTLERKDGMKFIFGELAPLQYIEDRNGNRITLIREGGGTKGPVVQVRAPHDHWIDLRYDSDNRIIEAGDNAGQTVRYEYDSHGRLVKVIDPMGRVTRYDYNSKNQMTAVIDARDSNIIENTYNEFGQVATQTLGGAGTYRFTYERRYHCRSEQVGRKSYTIVAFGEIPCSITPGEVVTPTGLKRQLYFSEGSLFSEYINPEKSPEISLFYGRDSHDDLETVNESTNVFKGYGDAYTPEASSRKTTYLTRDSVGNITKINQTARRQTGGGSEENGPELTTSLAYNDFSEPTSITDALGRTTRYGYDTKGNLTSIVDPMGHSTTFGYDSEGELTFETDADGNTTSYKYENGDQVGVIDPLGHETQIAYDTLGQPVGIRDPEGRMSELTYDHDNELTSETNPAGEKTTYGYDADGNIVSVTDPRDETQTGTYNAFGQLASWTNALDQTTSYTYDGQGRLTSTTDPAGQKTSYSYDPLNRLESVSFGSVDGGSPTSSITYAYEIEGNLSSAKDSHSGTYTLGYDLDHHLTSETGPNGTVGYTYDANGEPTSMSIGEKEVAKYAYNQDGQLTGIEAPNGNVSLAYDPDGLNTQTVLPDGDSENYSYDAASQLAGIDYENPEGAQMGSLQYARDALGRITTISGSLARTGLPEAIDDLSYNAANELTSSGGHTLEYDADGNLTKDASSTYTYNDRNQLTELVQGSNKRSFAYDPFGRRLSKTVNGTTTSYLYDGGNVANETTEGKTAEVLNGLALDERYARTTSTGTDSYLTEELGSTIALANSSGTPTTEYTYDPFGATTSTGDTSTNPYQYTGRENDGDGLQYNRARYYNPTTTRFTNQDPAGMAGSGTNLYAYTGGDPLNYTDPTGYSFLEELGENITGFMDAYTGGLTRDIRSGLGIGQPDFSSGAYEGGVDAGILGAIITPGDEEAAALDAGEDVATEAAEEAEQGPSWTWKTREKPGADDGISEYGKERVGEETISTAHRVTVEGDVVHQHQTYIGKYGGERQFPDEWVQYPDVGSP